MANKCIWNTVRLFSTTQRSMGRKVNIQKPRMPWIERRILNAVTEPLLPPDRRPLPEKCLEAHTIKENARKSELEKAYEDFRIKETFNELSEHKMVAICHILPMTPRDFFNVRINVHNAGMKLKFANNRLAKAAVQNSRLRNLEPYLTSDNVFILCEETRLEQLMLALKKIPELQLLGGLVEDRILSRAGMMDAAKLPPLDIMRGELLTILSTSARKTSSLLNRHQTELSANLSQLVKQEGVGD
ncbi:hypothetical protein EGW08_004558 [Elysia chlorotica]|uniref:Large ribosomal subunit protein uL10m n=1 Tax=Elysia chlorotica TaxID=188477 RepID=A0A433U1N0_ELYCH|nr:hypothetical protein EGW08_004558 [Elysia chlorotica]